MTLHHALKLTVHQFNALLGPNQGMFKDTECSDLLSNWQAQPM
jgi:hypothetical protein